MRDNIFTHDVKPVKMYREIMNKDGSTSFEPIHGFHAVERASRKLTNLKSLVTK